MGQDTSQIRREIEETRARMGDTVEAIGYKADVPSRVRDNVNERIASVKGSIGDAVSGTKSAVFGKAHDVSDAASDTLAGARDRAGDATESTKRAVSVAMENPLGLALGALALGFLGGLMLPVSDIEREKLGPVRESIADRAHSVVGEAMDAGKTILTETLSSVTESAQKHGSEIAQHAVAGTAFETAAAPAPAASADTPVSSTATASGYRAD
jgi:hypothetical protein